MTSSPRDTAVIVNKRGSDEYRIALLVHMVKNRVCMKTKFIFAVATFFVLLSTPQMLLAYEPMLIPGSAAYEINEPDMARGYYSELNGIPMRFRLNFTEPGNLDVFLRVPAIANANKKVTANVKYKDTDGNMQQLELYKPEDEWIFYEDDFSGNAYYLGPEAHVSVSSGTHTILVSSEPDNEKPFVLVVGSREDQTLSARYRTMVESAKIKNFVYSEFPLLAFYNYYGLVLLMPAILIVTVIIYLGIGTYLKFRRADEEEMDENESESENNDSV